VVVVVVLITPSSSSVVACLDGEGVPLRDDDGDDGPVPSITRTISISLELGWSTSHFISFHVVLLTSATIASIVVPPSTLRSFFSR